MTVPMDKDVVTEGYYRYTDIMFEWYKAVPDDCAEELKAFLYPSCITSPEHPLANAEGGLELYVGTLKANHDVRLLYSLAQVEYIRYWLYEMGITPQKIPLPNSEYLVAAEHFSSLAPTTCRDDGELKKVHKNTQKASKRLKGVDPMIQDLRDSFERLRKLWQDKKARHIQYMAIDFESWEGSALVTEVTEFGYSLVRWEGEEEKRERGHWIKSGSNRNGRFVPDHRDYYQFGKSTDLPRKEFNKKVIEFILEITDRAPTFLVFHDPKGDIPVLQAMGMPIDNLIYSIPDSPPTQGIYIVDTRRLFRGLEGAAQYKSLSRVARILGFRDLIYYHNAGNDAEYTMMCMISMASGSTIDAQREERWPTRPEDVVPGVRREYAREPRPEDDSDYDDDWY